MRLEYRVLEIAKNNEQECNFFFLDFNNPTNFSLDTTPATYQIVGHNTPDDYANIVLFVCDRLKRNRNRCFCSHLKAKSTKQISDKELLSQAFSSHLEMKTRELKKELSTAKEGLKIEREE
ncbi:13127_t:CDS:2, partial [Funneliformis geosporum]